MQAGVFTDHDVSTVATRVLVDGVHRPHVEASWEASIDGDLPAQVLAGTGIKERSGQVDFAHSSSIMEQSETPWTGDEWPPARGARVEIWDDVETPTGPSSYRRFYGRIDDVWGDQEVSASIVDDWDLYRRPVTVLPMQKYMPSVRTGPTSAPDPYWAYLTAWGPAYKAIEQVGRGILPPVGSPGRVMLHCAVQGSVVPDVGGVIGPPTALHAAFTEGVDVVADMAIREHSGQSVGAGSDNLAITVRASRRVWTDQGTVPYVTVTSNDNGNSVSVYLLASGAVQVLQGGTVVSEQVVDYGTGDLIGVSVLWTANNIHVYSIGTGVESSAPSPGAPPSLPSASCRMRWVAGVRIVRGVSWAKWIATQRAVLAAPVAHYRPAWGGGLDASRLIEGSTAEQVLSEYAQRQLMSIWLDENGTLQLWGASRLASLRSTSTLSTKSRLEGLPWRQSWASVRSSVRVDYQEAALTRSRYWGIALWQQDSATQLQNGDIDTKFAEPGADEDWIEPDFAFEAANLPERFNVGNGSYWGATYSTETVDGNWGHSYVSFSARQIGPRKVALEHIVSGLPEGGRLHLRTPPREATSALWMRWRDTPLPIIRGRALTQWTDVHLAPAQAGPSWAPEFVHDFSWWGRAVDAGILRDWLAPQLAAPIATIAGLSGGFDPRRQLGDVITVDAETTHGASLDVLLVGIRETRSTAGPRQELDVRVRSATRPDVVTYAEERNTHTGSYIADRTARAGKTYKTVRDSPLEG